MKRKTVNGDEVDAIDGKNAYNWRAGDRKRIKRQVNRRERREARRELR